MTQPKSHILILCFLLLVAASVCAQNQTSSPFSAFAYGDLNDNTPNALRAMGGVSVGMRDHKAINPAQPASYTSCDSMTFMFDIAASVMWSRYHDATGMQNKANGNLEYLALQLPLYKRNIALSAGLLPYTSVGYDIAIADSINSDYHFTKSYVGQGGISEAYVGLGFNIMDWLALGANFYYMFGKVEHARALTFDESNLHTTIQYMNMEVGSVRFRYGLQLFHTFGDHSFALGGIFENKMKIKNDFYEAETAEKDTFMRYEGVYETPMMYGAGLSYSWANRLTVAFDYQRHCMGSALYGGLEGRYSGLQDRNRYAFGLEYRHNPTGRRYVDRMLWRAGITVADEYRQTVPDKAVTATVGVGFPLRAASTVINTTLEYQHRGSQAVGLEDNTLRLVINAAVSENWFFKRKL